MWHLLHKMQFPSVVCLIFFHKGALWSSILRIEIFHVATWRNVKSKICFFTKWYHLSLWVLPFGLWVLPFGACVGEFDTVRLPSNGQLRLCPHLCLPGLLCLYFVALYSLLVSTGCCRPYLGGASATYLAFFVPNLCINFIPLVQLIYSWATRGGGGVHFYLGGW